MKNNHALIDAKTGLVRNIIVWEGAEWLPPKDYYVVHDCEGAIGDFWDQEQECFFTRNKKRRYRDASGRLGEKDMTPAEEERVRAKLDDLYKDIPPLNDQTRLDQTLLP